MTLYQKYRPNTLEEIIGNASQINSLKALAAKEDKPHTYLITGPSGTGKTTIARILASLFGASWEVREINSSNNRGIDTAREIQEQMRFSPIGGNSVAYIIDEVHKTTNDWQNAMLKPLEDTPRHVFFFLCTTDPQKLIPAIKTRCTPITMKSLDDEEMYALLRRVNKAENLNLSKDLLGEVIVASNGSPRSALTLLEQLASVESPEDRADLLKSFKVDDESDQTLELCRALLAKKPWATIAGLIKECDTSDVEKIRYAVLGYASAVLLSKTNAQAALMLDCFSQPFYNTGKAGLVLAAFQATTLVG